VLVLSGTRAVVEELQRGIVAANNNINNGDWSEKHILRNNTRSLAVGISIAWRKSAKVHEGEGLIGGTTFEILYCSA